MDPLSARLIRDMRAALSAAQIENTSLQLQVQYICIFIFTYIIFGGGGSCGWILYIYKNLLGRVCRGGVLPRILVAAAPGGRGLHYIICMCVCVCVCA